MKYEFTNEFKQKSKNLTIGLLLGSIAITLLLAILFLVTTLSLKIIGN